MTVLGISSQAEPREDDAETEPKHPHGSVEDLCTPSSTPPHPSRLGPQSPPSPQPFPASPSPASASAADEETRGAREPLLDPTGNGSSKLPPPPDVTSTETETETDEEEEEEEEGVPYDRGWAWMVVLGLFVNFTLIGGFLKSSGLIFVELLRKFNAPATHTALLFAVRSCVYSFSGFCVMNVLLGRFPSRTLILTGAVLMSLSAILSSFADNLTLLICVHSVLLGMGTVMVSPPGEVLVSRYFRKRRALALGLAKCGASIGNVATPPLLNHLLSEYGLTGTLLLYGAITLHSVPAGLLHRPISYFSRRHRPPGSSSSPAAPGPGKPGARRCGCHGDGADAGSSCERGCNGVTRVRDGNGVTSVHNGNSVTRVHDGNSVTSVHDGNSVTRVHDGNSVTRVHDGNCVTRAHGCHCAARGPLNGLKPIHVPKTLTVIETVALGKPTDPRRDGRHPRRPYRPKSHEMLASGILSVEECDVVMLAKSQPDFGVLSASTPPPFRKRSVSQVSRDRPGALHTPAPHHSVSSLLQALSHSSVMKYMSMSSLDGISTLMTQPSDPDAFQTEHHHHVRGKDSTEDRTTGCGRAVAGVLRCPRTFISLLDFSLIREPLFLLLLAYILTYSFVNMTLDYLPALASDNGVGETRSAVLVSVVGGLDFLSRLTSGFVANLKVVRVSTMIAVSFLALGLALQFVRFLSLFQHFVALAVLHGLLSGVSNCLYAVVIIDFLGLKNLGKGLGFCGLAYGLITTGTYPLMGYLRDVTGSYVMTYHVIGMALILGAGVLIAEGPVRRFQERRQRQQQLKNDLP